MATKLEEFHEYMRQPAYVIKGMRFGQWERMKAVCEGRITWLQAIEAARDENVEMVRAALPRLAS